MSAISPTFRTLFSTAREIPIQQPIKLPDEDPEAFRRICQSAHGFFIPQADISTDMLVKIADIIQRYHIPPNSMIRTTAVFCFIEQTLRQGMISITKLLKLLQVAKFLGAVNLRRLLEEVFLFRPLHFEMLPLTPDVGLYDAECAILLANIMLRGARCRAQVASTLLDTIQSTLLPYEQEKFDLAALILKEGPSLQEIRSRLGITRGVEKHQIAELIDAHGVVAETTADMTLFLNNAIKGGSGDEDGTEKGMLDPKGGIKRLDIKVAKEVCSDYAVNFTSPTNTGFEDIDFYCQPVDAQYDDYTQSDDDVIS